MTPKHAEIERNPGEIIKLDYFSGQLEKGDSNLRELIRDTRISEVVIKGVIYTNGSVVFSQSTAHHSLFDYIEEVSNSLPQAQFEYTNHPSNPNNLQIFQRRFTEKVTQEFNNQIVDYSLPKSTILAAIFKPSTKVLTKTMEFLIRSWPKEAKDCKVTVTAGATKKEQISSIADYKSLHQYLTSHLKK